MSNFAFGTYRVTDENPQHIQALIDAIDSGITLIDTSTNYMDGAAERAIAKALRTFDDEKRQGVEIVSKFGYIQATQLKRHKEEPFEDVVEFSEDCYHSISKSFLQDQLALSLSRLEVKKIDCYLLHNPEYYLLNALNKNMPHDEALDRMFDRIFDAFVALEEQVQIGTVVSYGISSNSFSKNHKDLDFLPYEDLITLADKAAEIVGNETHNFTTIELPINLLEQEGLKCAAWAKENGLRVLSNRPLNAQKDEMMFRLADYDESHDYYNNLNELLEVSDNETLKPLYNLIEQLDENKHKFGWIGDYDNFLYAQIIPHIKSSIEKIDEEVLETLLGYIDRFLLSYRKMVAYECSKTTRVLLKEELDGCTKRLQECALGFLKERESISYIIVGMRKPLYVAEVLGMN